MFIGMHIILEHEKSSAGSSVWFNPKVYSHSQLQTLLCFHTDGPCCKLLLFSFAVRVYATQ